ncbi:MAG: hypothetical protein MK207_04345 [Saprospiraceae bacterium]|nr:hypothetical protein [Saprospiraceae bacterium]
MPYFSLLICLLFYSTTFGQYYMYGGYNYAAIDMKGANTIVATFNETENHSIPPLTNNFHGYRVGVGKYSRHTVMELGFGNLISNQSSSNPNQLKESAEVVVNFMSAHFLLGVKPFPKEFLTCGMAMHLGGQRIRYSFGGDYRSPVNNYIIGTEFYIDYGIKIRFMLKKSQRDKYFYLLRIRPYVHLQSNFAIGNFETELNQTPNVPNNAIEDNMSHFGFQISLVVPFIGEEDRTYLFEPSKKKKKIQDRKEKPKGPI